MIRTLFSTALFLSFSLTYAQQRGFEQYQPKAVKEIIQKNLRRSTPTFLPEIEKRYQWNLINGDWDSTEVLRYVYDNGELDTIRITNPVTDAPIAREIHTKTPQLEEVLRQTYTGSGYENESRRQVFFNQFGYLIGEELQTWNNNSWETTEGFKTILEYNADNRISTAEMQFWDTQLSAWLTEVKYFIGWMNDGRFDGYLLQVPSEDGTLEDYIRIDAQYSAAAIEADTVYIEIQFMGTWMEVARYIVSRWDNYDDILAAEPVSYIEQADLGSGYTDSGRQTRVDLANGGYIDTYEELNEDNIWVIASTEEVAYNENNDLLYERGYDYGSGVQMVNYWDNFIYTYDVQNRRTEVVFQSYDFDAQGLANQTRSVYPQYIDVTSTTAVKPTTIKAYPNPSAGLVQVEGLKSGVQGRIFNLLGAEVLRFQAQGENHTLDLSKLPSGVYILEAGGKSHRLVKQ